MPQQQFIRDHVITRDAYRVNTNIGGFVSLDYDGAAHPVNLDDRQPDGTPAFPRLEELKKGVVVRATYSTVLGVDPLVSSVVPELLSMTILGAAPVYELVVETFAANSSELEDPRYITSRIQGILQDQGRVVGIRKVA